MKLRPLLEEFNQDQFYQSIKVHALYSIKISKQDQQASRVEPLYPKLSRVLSRVRIQLSVPGLGPGLGTVLVIILGEPQGGSNIFRHYDLRG